ncbi:hypothetical protein D9M70_551580 [compost metagenome]
MPEHRPVGVLRWQVGNDVAVRFGLFGLDAREFFAVAVAAVDFKRGKDAAATVFAAAGDDLLALRLQHAQIVFHLGDEAVELPAAVGVAAIEGDDAAATATRAPAVVFRPAQLDILS